MAVKIDSSIEEIKNWISQEDVYDILTAFDVIEMDEFSSIEEDTVSLTQMNNKSESIVIQKMKIRVDFANSDKTDMKINNFVTEAA
ncbi:hypothetical protein [Enterococcus avium]|uniref:hypothetical protein n=1 Tax=Enterococcus avium TaxID=33945 RepID=UPI001F57CA36|nr:hypothetical protein [Enterococcus avium]